MFTLLGFNLGEAATAAATSIIVIVTGVTELRGHVLCSLAMKEQNAAGEESYRCNK